MAKLTALNNNSLTADIYYNPAEVENMKKSGFDVESVYYPISDSLELIDIEQHVVYWANADVLWIFYDRDNTLIYYMSENELRRTPYKVTLKAVRLTPQDVEEIEKELEVDG